MVAGGDAKAAGGCLLGDGSPAAAADAADAADAAAAAVVLAISAGAQCSLAFQRKQAQRCLLQRAPFPVPAERRRRAWNRFRCENWNRF